MNFESAITAVKNGNRVKRSSWTGRYLQREVSEDGTKVKSVTTRTMNVPYTSTQEDITADDWVQI